jgi:hypothetical protein
VVIVRSPDGRSERAAFYTEVPEISLERAALTLPADYDFASREVDIEVITCTNLEFDIEGVHCF